MSQENVDVVTRGYDAANQTGKLSSEVFAPDLVLDLTESAPDFRVLRGDRGLGADSARVHADLRRVRVEIDEVIHSDEVQVVTAVNNTGG